MSDSKSSATASAPIFFYLFLAFMVLKLCGVIDWSWWWITAPLWGPFALLIVVVLTVFACIMLFGGSKRPTTVQMKKPVRFPGERK